jgi:hypothetical protein
MQPTTSNIFHTRLAVHPSSLPARRMLLGNRSVGDQWYSTIGAHFGTRGMEASSWGVLSPELWRIPKGGDA